MTFDTAPLVFRDYNDAKVGPSRSGGCWPLAGLAKQTPNPDPSVAAAGVCSTWPVPNVNAVAHLSYCPVMRWIGGGTVMEEAKPSATQMGRFGSGVFAGEANLATLIDLLRQRIDKVRSRRPTQPYWRWT